MDKSTRRRFLQVGGFGSVFGLTGCLRLTSEGGNDSSGPTSTTERPSESDETTSATEETSGSDETTSATEETPESGEATSTTEDSSNQYTIVEGTVSSKSGSSLEGHQLEIFNEGTREFHKISIDDGNFVQTVEPDSSIDLTFFYEREDGATDVDGVPLLYSLGNSISVSGEENDLGQLTLPQAYRTDIRIVDTDGNPVEGFPIRFRCPNGSGTGVRSFTTNSDGYAKFVDASQTGFYFAGTITVEGGKEDGGRRLREINVAEQSEYTVKVVPDRYDL